MGVNEQLSPSQLLRGIEHPLRCVRDFSLKFFSTRPTLIEGLSDCVLRSVDRYGIDGAFTHFYQVVEIPCTEPILQWLLKKSASNFGAKSDRVVHHKYCWNWIASADLPHLKNYFEEIESASNRWNESDWVDAYYST